MTVHPGRHFLQIPGPTNVPDRVLRAISMPTIDHRGPDFAALVTELLPRVSAVFGTALGGVEMGLMRSMVPSARGGVAAAVEYLADSR